jgi:O-antigen/teichoic acid export membrane protein
MASTSGIIRNNIIANALGRSWTILSGIIFVPIYIGFLGSSYYGLIVFYATLVATLVVLDVGLSSALSRELAIRTAGEDASVGTGTRSAGDLVRTIEVLSWSTGACLGVLIIATAPLITKHWLHNSGLPLEHVTKSLQLMGFAIGAQWPSFAYSGALQGLQKQVELNLIRSVASTMQAVGVICILWLVAPTIEGYLIWAVLIQGSNTLFLRHVVWRHLGPLQERPRFRWTELGEIWRFAAGIAGVAVLSIGLMQADKIILARYVPFSTLAAYGVAWSVGSILTVVASPIFLAVLPKLSQLFAARRFDEQRLLYLRSTELVALLVVPVWVICMFHARELMFMWMGPTPTAQAVTPILIVLSIGFYANAMMSLPFGLQVASGWTSLSVIKNVLAVALAIPSLFIVIPAYGPVGAAAVWVAINLGYIAFEIPFMHRRLLKEALFEWYGSALLLPLCVGTLVGLVSCVVVPRDTGRVATFFWLTACYLSVIVVLAGAMPSIRLKLLRKFQPYVKHLFRT